MKNFVYSYLKSFIFKIDRSVILPMFLPFVKSKTLDVPYIPALPGNCGIASLLMFLKYKGCAVESSGVYMDSFKTPTTYVEPIGWLHSGLCKIAKSFDKSVVSFMLGAPSLLISKLNVNTPVVISVYVPSISNLDQKVLYRPIDASMPMEGHMCIVIGFEKTEDGLVFIIHDPRNIGIYGSSVRVPFDVLAEIYTGRGISSDGPLS